MKIIENKKLTEILGKTIGVDVESGIIVAVDKDDNYEDITNHVLELVVMAVEDRHTFIGLNRMIEITVSETSLSLE